MPKTQPVEARERSLKQTNGFALLSTQKFIAWRKPAFLMIFTVLIGPGILVNVVLKDHWGRARPRDIEAFGGKESYISPWMIGKAQDGKSFPCGHCSMGFYMAVPFLFFRQKRKALAYTCLSFGIFFGFLLGTARMMAGGHFLSDVLWSGGIVWLTALVGYSLFKLDKPLVYEQIDSEIQKKQAQRSTVIIAVLVSILTISLLLATPYISQKELQKTLTELNQLPFEKIHLHFDEGNINIIQGADLKMHYKVNAFGFPNSKMSPHWSVKDSAVLNISKSGWFTEVRNNINLQLPNDLSKDFVMQVKKGKIFIQMPEKAGQIDLSLIVEKGDVVLKAYRTSNFYLQYESENFDNQLKRYFFKQNNVVFTNQDAKNRFKIVVKKGNLRIE